MSLPESVHECFYAAAVKDIKTYLAFANCMLTDGGERCFRANLDGSKCLNWNWDPN